MDSEQSNIDDNMWDRLLEAEEDYQKFERKITESGFSLRGKVNRVAITRRGLTDSRFWWLGFNLLLRLDREERAELLPDLIPHLFRVRQGDEDWIIDLILSVPHDYIIKNIENLVEPFLSNDEENYYVLLHFYTHLASDLALKFARLAAKHTNPHIKDVGIDYLERQGNWTEPQIRQ